jgi:RNA polymerase sigma factor (sigma-70 family)
MGRVRAGDTAAVQTLCERYGQHVLRAVRRKMHQRLRIRYDSQDFTQAVWASILAVSPDRFTFANPEELVRYLARMASNKVVDVYREQNGPTRDVSRERPLDASGAPVADRRASTPSQVAIADERWEQLLSQVAPAHRAVVQMLRDGHTYLEIAERLHVHTKTIQRIVRNLSERLDP